ncbi:hypothetical protein LVJ94_11870 [Pendulispora rubella]|uniref:Uncharacterized protein n=1 Tax=Pendulispora rubella TaxID=2741070 RepID=A0ABZ2LAH8_9BACT
MGMLLFGQQETVTCIVDVEIHGQHDEPLCLAYKTSVFHAGAGVYFRDDGYVLKPRNSAKEVYYPLTQDDILLHQGEGSLPTPLPAYSIPAFEYVWGYFLWIVIAAVILWEIGKKRWQARTLRRLQSELAQEPPRQGGPSLRTDADQFIYASVKPLLRQGEQVLHQAYALDRYNGSAGYFGALLARGMFVALTTQRLLFFPSKHRFRGVVLQTTGSEAIELQHVQSVGLDGNVPLVYLTNGDMKPIVVPLGESALSNQRDFIRGLLELGDSRAAA